MAGRPRTPDGDGQGALRTSLRALQTPKARNAKTTARTHLASNAIAIAAIRKQIAAASVTAASATVALGLLIFEP
jgi:hypothetical protein